MSRDYIKHNKDQNHPKFPHGLFSGYRAGCRCILCVQANRDKKREAYHNEEKYQRASEFPTKICGNCGEEKPLNEFQIDKGIYVRSYCKACDTLMKREAELRRRYNLTVEQYQEIYKRQNGRCAICKRDFLELSKAPFVDHDHKTNKVRGLLCTKCNFAIGQLDDSYERCLEAALYLKGRFNDQDENPYTSSGVEAPSSYKKFL